MLTVLIQVTFGVELRQTFRTHESQLAFDGVTQLVDLLCVRDAAPRTRKLPLSMHLLKMLKKQQTERREIQICSL